MSFDWREYILLAERLGRENAEASLRAALSRAYYAAFNVARNYVEKKYPSVDVSERVPSIHTVVWGALRDNRNRDEISAAAHGERLKGKRVEADYRGTARVNMNEVQDAMNRARAVCARLGCPIVPPATTPTGDKPT